MSVSNKRYTLGGKNNDAEEWIAAKTVDSGGPTIVHHIE